MPGVLDGIRVLDFGRYIAGPFCGMLLGDMGGLLLIPIEDPAVAHIEHNKIQVLEARNYNYHNTSIYFQPLP